MGARQQFENIFGIKLTKGKHIEILAMLAFIEMILAFSYLGYIQLAPISVTTMHIFVIVAAMFFGPLDAMVVGLVFGLTSMWKASVTSVEIGDIIFSPSLSGKPLESILMAVGTRLLFALIAGFMFRWFFSKKREHIYLGIAVISAASTAIHSLLVYVCMVAFFDAQDTKTSTSFDQALIINNLILYLSTVLIIYGLYRLMKTNAIQNFFAKTSLGERETIKKVSAPIVTLYVVVFALAVFVSIHFVSSIGTYINKFGENESSAYLSWLYSLVLQFIVGFIGIFGALILLIRWIQEYYSSMTLEANLIARESAETASKSKSTFLFNMSHDIRTPMNAILGFTDIGLRHIDDKKRVKDSLTKIKSSGAHLLSLINDILEMSRIEAGKLVISESPHDIREIIKSIEFMSQALAVNKGVEFKTAFGKIGIPYVYLDDLHLNEVLINLISNAIKYTPEGGHVVFSVNQMSNEMDGKVYFRFEVADDGIGMSEEFQKHLFESFVREETAVTSKTEGVGLGLSIVKKILDIGNGTISVRSKPGEGSTFTVEISFKVMNQDEIREYRKSYENNINVEMDELFRGKRVLLVEDNELNREIAIELLSETGFIVEYAENGQMSYDMIKEKGINYYDIVLMDIQMPVMNGYEATSLIRQLPDGDKIPIIALSANAFKEDIDKSIEAGMNAHIPKPIDTKQLLDAMKNLI